MKIALVSTPCVAVPPPQYGGTELVVATLAEELLRRGHQVVLYATGDSRLDGAEIRWLYETAVWPPDVFRDTNHAAFAMRDILARDDIDVIHANIIPAVAMSAFVEIPMVYTVHHAAEPALGELYRAARSSNLSLVAISERHGELLGEDLISEVIHHGLQPNRYRLGAGRGPAVYIGRFAEEKGVHLALEAAERAAVPLTLAGKPHWKDEDYFREHVEPRLSRPGVVWNGEASHEPKVELLAAAVATLFPIQWEEPFGLVMIESMLCGSPVLAFARGSAPELVDEGVTGYLVRDVEEMAWRLRRLRSAPDSFDRSRCRQRAVERFSAGVMAESYLSLYSRLVGSPALSVVPVH